ncbi:MAG: hypothetical protein D6800_00780 [Candidatus Zixiibacteriota bacterium]|nr:MAG: hypothetical protein D6800_00780 [candidate division Zixibacteria bacterium]
MKARILFVPVLLLSLVGFATAGQQAEKPWFDMKNCAMCSHLTENPELMQHMTWEHHKLDNGIISVTTVDREYVDAYRAVSAEMQATADQLKAGKQLPLCGMCTAYGSLFAEGARLKRIDTERGAIYLVTSDKPEVVKDIHAWADRTNDEMKKMMMLEHEGHQH